MKVTGKCAEPVQVYLDSSDFSDLSREAAIRTDAVWGRIDALHDGGLVEFRFSLIHVAEAAHVDPASKAYALQRAATIKAVCGNKAFLDPARLLIQEVLGASRLETMGKEIPGRSYAYVQNADWLPENLRLTARRMSASLVKGFRNRVNREIEKILADAGNRAQRRRLSKEFVGKEDLTPKALEIAAKSADAFSADWKKAFPLTDRFWKEDMPLGALQGRLTMKELEDECLCGLGDVENFIGWCVDEIPSASEVVGTLRDAGTAGADLVGELRGKITEQIAWADMFIEEILGSKSLPDADEPTSIRDSVRRDLQARSAGLLDVDRIRANHLQQFFDQNRKMLTESKVSNEAWTTKVVASSLGSLPSFDAPLEIAAAHFARNVDLRDTPRKPLRSDVGDIMHCTYLPYVDVFRADKFTASVVRQIASRYNTTLATSLPEALDIATALSETRR